MRAPTRNRTDTPRDAVAECIGIHPLDWHKDLPSTLTEPICNDTITWYAAGCAPILVNQYMRYHPDENKLKVAADAMWDALLKCYDPDVIAGIRTSFPAWMKMSIWGKVGRHNKLVSDRKGIVAKNALPQSTINAELSSLSTEGFDPLAGRHNESGGDLNIIALSGSGSQNVAPPNSAELAEIVEILDLVMRNVAKKKSASKRGWHPIEKAWFDVLYKEFVSVASGQNSNWPAYGTLQGFLNENTRSDEERKNAEWRCAQATTQIKSLMKEALEAYYGDMPLPEEIVW